MEVSFRGLDKLDSVEISRFNKLSSEFKKILEKDFSEVDHCNVVIDVKKLEKGGKARFVIGMRVEGDKFLEAKEEDWDLNRAMHKVFNNIKHEINHRFREK